MTPAGHAQNGVVVFVPISPMTNNILYLMIPFSIAWFGVLLRQAFEMERDAKFQRMWGTIAGSLVPLGVSAVVWVSQGDASVLGRSILLGFLGAAIGASLMIWVGFLVAAPAPVAAPIATNVVQPSAAPPIPAKNATNDEEFERQQLLKVRGEMELLVRDAGGIPLKHQFNTQSMEMIKVIDGATSYEISTHVAHATAVWLNMGVQSGSAKKLYVSKSAQRGKPIDIRQLRVSRGSDTISIGQRAFIELEDGKILQLLLVGVLWYRAGDDVDEARFRYKIYGAGEFLFDPL
jgi:hypothetical protein